MGGSGGRSSTYRRSVTGRSVDQALRGVAQASWATVAVRVHGLWTTRANPGATVGRQ